ncbi:extensin family protein [Sphingomonas sp. RP10(2022)]|uniref:Extensin family protein n=1 Tax=Sphingomonas liriopis TaxID=2949094 RepID=A0A9X2HNQ0_9SPHN|nr:extensin family protein [Sphingomonas liriopis]MCP3734363.1 extensin family protein [Sphingomonas liriopis]
MFRYPRLFGTFTLLALLAACGSRERPAPPPRDSTATVPVRQTAQCLADLRGMNVAYRVLPDKDYGNGCGLSGAVQLVEIGVPVTGLGAVRCGEARAFSAWVRNAVAPAAYQILGSELASVQSMGSYACRNVVGSVRNADRRSGHAVANAVDIGGVTLKDGRRIGVLRDWASPDPQVQRFWTTIHDSACRRFGTVLSPAYNAAHRDHLHLEDDGARLCR